MAYKFKLTYPDGDVEESDDTFRTKKAAEEAAWEEISDYRLGGQILHESNPGDYSDDDDSDEIEYDVFEV